MPLDAIALLCILCHFWHVVKRNILIYYYEGILIFYLKKVLKINFVTDRHGLTPMNSTGKTAHSQARHILIVEAWTETEETVYTTTLQWVTTTQQTLKLN